MPRCVVVNRLKPNCGRNQDKTYVNVAFDAREFEPLNQSLADWLAEHPAHPWSNPLLNDFVVEITAQQYADFANGVNKFFYDNRWNEPLWQQQNDVSGSVASLGSFADPEDSQSAFTVGVPLIDDRWIVRVYTDDPVSNPGTAVHVANEEFDENPASPLVERFLRLFSPTDSPVNTNAANQRTQIGDKLMDFDFGSSDGLPPGVARFNVAIGKAGRGDFFSNHRYRVMGPNGETSYIFQVFGKTINVATE